MCNLNCNKASIIIPAKNEQARLALCLTALQKLDYTSDLIEIIIMDNGSKDSTVDIAKSFGCRVYIEPNLSVAGLRNAGARLAISDILCFIDADVMVSPGWLCAAFSHINHSDIACVTGPINIPQEHTWVEKTWSLNRKTIKEVFEVSWASSMNMVVMKNAFDKIGGFSNELITGEDVDLSNRLKSSGFKIIFDSKAAVTHIGEAKTLRQLIKKERWRGYSDLDMLLHRDFKFSNLMNATQPLFFISCCISLVLATCIGNVYLVGTFSALTLSLPFVRTVIVSKKNQTVEYIPQLLIIWLTYYIARSLAIFDNIFAKMVSNGNPKH